MISAAVRIAWCACVFLVATACEPKRTPAQGPARSNSAFRPLGRTLRALNGNLSFAWPASGFEVRFRGTGLSADLSDTPTPDETPETDFLEVRVDNAAPRAVPLRAGMQTVVLAHGLSPGAHVVTILKRTEPEVGTVSLHQLTVDVGGIFMPPQPPPLLALEAIGDSITAGFGCEGPSAECSFSAVTENALATYTAIAARELEANYFAVAWSGKGVFRNDDVRDVDTFPSLYDRALPLIPAPSWDHARTRANIVVINLGTNDCARDEPPMGPFHDAYAAFVARVRQTHPRAYVVLVLGPMLYDEGEDRRRSSVEGVLTRIVTERRQNGDARIGLLPLWANPEEGVGCQFHPNLRAHQRFAQELVAFLREHHAAPAAH